MWKSKAANIVRRLRVDENDDVPQWSALTEDGKYHLYGFTIYRTDYSEGTNELWEELIDDLTVDGEVDLSYLGAEGKPDVQDDDVDQLTSLFTIDARSNKDMLDGCSVAQLCEMYNGSVGGIPVNRRPGSPAFFYVDAEAFQSMAQEVPFIKMGDPQYDPAKHKIENHPRFPEGQYYWGWFRIEVEEVLDAWEMLENDWVDRMAPQMLRNPEFLTLFNRYKKIPNNNNLEM